MNAIMRALNHTSNPNLVKAVAAIAMRQFVCERLGFGAVGHAGYSRILPIGGSGAVRWF